MDDRAALEGADGLQEFASLTRRWAAAEPGPDDASRIGLLGSVVADLAAVAGRNRGRQDLLDAVYELRDAAEAPERDIRRRRLMSAAQFLASADRVGADRPECYLAAIVQTNGDVLFVRHNLIPYETASMSLVAAKVCGDVQPGTSAKLTQVPVDHNGLHILVREHSPEPANPYAEHMLDTVAAADLRKRARHLRGPVAFLYLAHPQAQAEVDTMPIPTRLFDELGAAHHAAALVLTKKTHSLTTK
ncbi:hypothetical protein AB0O31_33045 [Kitasatospora cineracea]|uniref:hypothetical protein n=1 Tax=Kitasatospora cineracea TaxID=88074 RepID=UPI0034334299